MPRSVIVAGARTPIGKLSGSLSSLSAAELGALAIKGALARSAVAPEEVDYVIMGQVIGAGAGQVPARQAARGAGIPMTTPASVVNKVCLSGLNAIYQADLMIKAGEADIVVAGGMESMSNAPHLLKGLRSGLRLGDATLEDAMLHDGLEDAWSHQAMGEDTEGYLPRFPAIDRARQDEFAAMSHERAARAAKDGFFAEEIVAVELPNKGGEPLVVSADEGVRPGTTAESLARLRPAFRTEGSITAGNASQISDGAAALVVMSEQEAARRKIAPLGRVLSYGMVAGPDTCLMTQPSAAARKALHKAGLQTGDVGLWEINEAFAAVTLASADDLGVALEVVNPNGGAVALGHPIGASGSRLALTLLHELGRRGGGVGVAALCGGGGQGDALVVKAS